MIRFYKALATSLGAGYAPVAPGTIGAIVACLIYYAIHNYFQFSELHFLSLVIVITGLGIVSCKNLEDEWGKDPQIIVIDEVVGLWITLLFVPFHWKYIIVALILFRFFDISKVLGIRRFESLPNGFGVMMDDVVAGVYANILLQVLILAGL